MIFRSDWTASAAAVPSEGVETTARLLPLFRQSLDVFTVVLVLGSLVAVTLIVKALLEIRRSRIVGRASIQQLQGMARDGDVDELAAACAADDSVVGAAVLGAARAAGSSEHSRRDAAELAASERIASVMRGIEPINLIGNLGPLIGLAGTVWGMILAFTSLGASGGQADPSSLSVGISKALFHTLLGLVLAIPCLFAFGILRGRADRLCTRALVIAGSVVDLLAADHSADRSVTRTPASAPTSSEQPSSSETTRAPAPSAKDEPDDSESGPLRWDDR